jgi:hypothetical protein
MTNVPQNRMDQEFYESMDFDQDDGLDEDGNIKFECARFWIAGKGGGWFCPLQGSEECDWECPL